MSTLPKYGYLALFVLTTVVYLLGMVAIDLMDVDAAQYASISREMRETGSFLQVYHRHEDYLDKPPLLFWLSACSYGLFGVSAFAYRLPSFLFTLLGVFATYRLGWLLYDRETGKIAALVLYTCQAYFLISHDVRTDTILANAVVFGTWQLTDYLRNRRPLNGALAFGGFALAMLQKGPIGLMVPGLAFAADWAYGRRWKLFLRWEWLAGGVLMLGLLSPMLWGLYRQFGADGIRFFFWTQSFGRLTGENVWKDDSDALFFTHTFLWAFLPWMVLAYYGVATRLWNLVRGRFARPVDAEVLTLGGFLLPFIALSTSQYKLPHYIFVVFPFAALLAARVIGQLLARVEAKPFRVFFSIQLFIAL
ncbi:MAG: glycosyltransferase family 39 protein, partial [Ferruginibacter sp.]|nr:glycosyltransferase family 39 protein [Cytophagales bacterium]